MTIVVTILIGVGVLLLVSAINKCPIVTTFQNILNNKPINTECK